MKTTRGQQGTFSSAQATGPRLAKRVQHTSDLLDAALKLIRLLDTPDEIEFLAPLIIREIIYRLLKRRARRAAEPSAGFRRRSSRRRSLSRGV
jgi:AraC-type transcriptional regulator N-terminus